RELGEPGLLDLGKLIPDAVAQRVHDALRAGVDLGYEGNQDGLKVLGDTASVLDLLDNLIDNALRYAGRGSMVTVTLSASSGEVCLCVEDNGPGVPPDTLPHLGERFFRVADTNVDGSGLGLAIVQRIAERHRATVIYRLAEPRGLRVEVQFPAAAP
ncbi:MAG: sensor histidine kinase, partial [Rhodanobacter sp.]